MDELDELEKLTRALSLFFERGKLTTFERGEAIVTPYSLNRTAFIIESGFVKVYAPSKAGRNNLLCILGRGDMLPMPGVFGVYTIESYYEAMNSVKTRAVPAKVLLDAAQQNNNLLWAVLWRTYGILMEYSNRVNTLDLRTQTERLASFLILLKQRFGIERTSGYILDVPITHVEIAEAISSTRETVSRLLGKLTREGIIEQRNHLIVVRDPARLERILE